MGIKEIIQRRIEKDCVKSTLSYESDGEIITEDVLLKRSKMPLIGDWARIYPPLNEDGSINWVNLIVGGKKNLYRLIIIFAILGLLFWWVTGILGANAEYMQGDKYVIVARTAFDKVCNLAGTTQTITPTNMTLINLEGG